jgi:hypothetical protein
MIGRQVADLVEFDMGIDSRVNALFSVVPATIVQRRLQGESIIQHPNS